MRDIRVWLAKAAFKAEIETHLELEEASNRKNGFSKKAIKLLSDSFELYTPRDRVGCFEPQFVRRRLVRPVDKVERKNVSMSGLLSLQAIENMLSVIMLRLFDNELIMEVPFHQ